MSSFLSRAVKFCDWKEKSDGLDPLQPAVWSRVSEGSKLGTFVLRRDEFLNYEGVWVLLYYEGIWVLLYYER